MARADGRGQKSNRHSPVHADCNLTTGGRRANARAVACVRADASRVDSLLVHRVRRMRDYSRAQCGNGREPLSKHRHPSGGICDERATSSGTWWSRRLENDAENSLLCFSPSSASSCAPAAFQSFLLGDLRWLLATSARARGPRPRRGRMWGQWWGPSGGDRPNPQEKPPVGCNCGKNGQSVPTHRDSR